VARERRTNAVEKGGVDDHWRTLGVRRDAGARARSPNLP
jgi:hypothetical protein